MTGDDGRPLIHAGDVYWVDFDPTNGSEQAGARPALVISDVEYNRRSDLVVVCRSRATRGHGQPRSSWLMSPRSKVPCWSTRFAAFIVHRAASALQGVSHRNSCQPSAQAL
ncbi:type II toxin-antitoxin system PemK/MazF family toxin [Phreatobacter sp.]|uniref:type II toxin-antitoxin system PemK/MazF family toxin n=1 Tax=Phreatobacter sp. TaxID=1966341 RepID=UPI0025D01828|nr:type II toxin-antitoxin system PemK/MazF family toxin [Phreatobacter sp.]